MKKIVLSLLPWIIVGIIAFFFGRALVENWHKLQPGTFTFNGWALLGTLLFVAAVALSGILWGRILSTLEGKQIRHRDAVRIHAASWLLKYVPGQVGSLVNKLLWARKNGISQKATATSFIYENVFTVIASLILSLPLVFGFGEYIHRNLSLFLPVLLLIPILLVLYRPVFYGLLNFAFKKMGRKPFRQTDFLTEGKLIGFIVLYLLPRIANGIGFVLVVASMVPITPDQYIYVGATYILASIVGLLAIFVPGGLGVREAIIVLFLGLFLPLEQAIVLSLVARLYATIADLGVAVVYLILNKGRIRQL